MKSYWQQALLDIGKIFCKVKQCFAHAL